MTSKTGRLDESQRAQLGSLLKEQNETEVALMLGVGMNVLARAVAGFEIPIASGSRLVQRLWVLKNSEPASPGAASE